MKKRILIIFIVIFILTISVVPVGAVWYGPSGSDIFYSPLPIVFRCNTLLADLMPNVTLYNNNGIYQFNEDVHYSTNGSNDLILSSLNRSNITLSSPSHSPNLLDVQYKLTFDARQDLDRFTLDFSIPMGVYDFQKYGIPQIEVPFGYTAQVDIEYMIFITDSNNEGMNRVETCSITGVYDQINRLIPLINPYVVVNGEQRNIINNVFVDFYEGSITFIADQGDEGFGDAGYYLWDSVLQMTESLEILLSNENDPYVWFDEPVYLIGTDNGVASTIQVNGFYLANTTGLLETETTFEMFYELDPDQTVMCYSSEHEEWFSATRDDDAIEIDEISSEQMRVLQFTDTLDNTFNYESDFAALKSWFESQTTYYSSNPLFTSESTSTYALGDGGLYIHYYADKMLNNEYSQTIADYYDRGYDQGFDNNQFNGDYVGWIAKSVGAFMDVQILPHFTIGGILGTIVAILVSKMFLKYFAGG